MKLLATLRRSAEKRAAFNRTRRALRSMPLDVARDLDIDPADAEVLARHAVYG